MGIGTAPSLSSSSRFEVPSSKCESRVFNGEPGTSNLEQGRRWRDAPASVAPVATGLASGGRERYWETERLTAPATGNATGTGGGGAAETPPPIYTGGGDAQGRGTG